MLIRKMEQEEMDTVLDLVWRVFISFEAPDYSEEGIGEFQKSIQNKQFIAVLKFYGAFEEDTLVGVIATRNYGNHLALFFVDGKYHRQGIGRKLLDYVMGLNTSGKMTVNAAPFAVPVYRKLGFMEIDQEQVTNGLRYTPMEIMFTTKNISK